jgi:xanthosine utilization system XapX-like protein
MGKLIYKPFGLMVGIIAGLVSRKVFEAVWGIFDKEEPPSATTREADWPKVLGAAAVQGVTFSVTRAAVERAGAEGFEHLTGIWPGDRHAGESQAAKAVR